MQREERHPWLMQTGWVCKWVGDWPSERLREVEEGSGPGTRGGLVLSEQGEAEAVNG